MVANLASLIPRTPPFQPIEAPVPTDWTIAIRYTGGGNLAAPTAVAPDQSGNIWITNTTTSSVTRLDPAGAFTANYAGGSGPIAIDLSGNAWTASTTSGSLEEITSAGAITTHAGSGLTMPNAIAIDGSGNIWAAGTGSPLSEFNSSGVPVTTTGYSGGGLTNGQSIAITPY
jgi:hypothetical protein